MARETYVAPPRAPKVDRQTLVLWSDDLLERIEQLRLDDVDERQVVAGTLLHRAQQLWGATGFWLPVPKRLGQLYSWVYDVQATCLLSGNEEDAA